LFGPKDKWRNDVVIGNYPTRLPYLSGWFNEVAKEKVGKFSLIIVLKEKTHK
jgi:hypothetical protein